MRRFGRIDLGGRDWQLSELGADGTPGAPVPAEVPGTVHTDLLAAGRIPDPFVGTNEKEVLWVLERDWSWSRDFDVPPALLRRGRVELVFDGLDTVAEVRLNGARLAESENMYVPLRIDVGGRLVAGRNRLEVRIQSPKRVRDERTARYGLKFPQAFDKAAAYIRKAPYSFSWDWGPELPTSGIWKPVRLEAGEARIADLWPRVKLAPGGAGPARVEVEVEVDAAAAFAGEVELALSRGAFRAAARAAAEFPAGVSTQRLVLEVPEPELWWPAGYGGQPLYRLQARLRSGRTLLDSAARRVGLRTIELQREPDASGESFRFRVNGVPVFCRGGNWIPDDSFLPRCTRESLARTLGMARQAHMNMLRVWGGGVYESDDFYDLCDEYGILVWQDFIFACGLYPDHLDWFRDSVRREAEANVKRLRGRACLALFCGNNECHQGWYEWGWGKSGKWDRFYGERLYHEVLPEVCARLAPEVAYWPGSSWGGETPNDQRVGDMHYWRVWHSREPAEGYEKLTCRFLSEFGFEGGPCMKTVREFAGGGELFPDSPVMLHHERCSNGPEKLAQYLETEFGPATRDIARWVYRSQYVQAHCVGTALRHTRRRFPDCGGVLFWQHNDCWPVTSWSCIDHRERPKALWYQARRDYAPAAASLADEAGELSAWLCGNRAADLPAGRLRVRLLDFEGRARFEKTVEFPGADRGGSFKVWSAPRGEVLGGDGKGLVLLADYLVGRRRVSRAVRTFVNCKDQPLGRPDIAIEVRPARQAGRFRVTLRTDRVALGVMLAADGDPSGLSDNFLCLVPGEPETLESSVGGGLAVLHAGS